VFVPVPLLVVDVAEVFMVGIEGLISERCLWRPVSVRVVVSRLPRDLGPDPLFVRRPMLICQTLYLSAGLVDSLVLLPLLSTRMRLKRRSHSI
jgi:hypothetical protein